MKILGIETSCDDTSAAVVEGSEGSSGVAVLSSIVSSQDALHSPFGGIVPELASRSHIEHIVPVVDEALLKGGVTMDDIEGIAVTRGPGLTGALLVGLSFAKAVSYSRGIPLACVNHIEGHSMAPFLLDREAAERGGEFEVPSFPFVSLIVSGGHTTLYLQRSYTDYRLLGETVDDAAGEAFDKTAKLLGLGYPGGPVIDSLAKGGSKEYFNFPRPLLSDGNMDFSFSGLKTAVLNHVQSFDPQATKKGTAEGISEELTADIAASFQEAVVDVLIRKSLWALEKTGAGEIALAGGVACNSRLREKMAAAMAEEGYKLFLPAPRYCTDNGAMIGAIGYHYLREGRLSGLATDAEPNWQRV